MLIWILVVFLLALFGALGFLADTVRSAVALVGFFVAVAAAIPGGALLRPLFAKQEVVNPITLYVYPILTAFVVASLLVSVVGFVVHYLIDKQLKFRLGDSDYALLRRLNQRAGVFVGLLSGVAHFVLIAWCIYVAGYITTQLSSEESAPGGVGLLNRARADLKETGLDRLAAAFDKVPVRFYDAIDVLGLIYHNPLVQGRLSSYPPYLSLGERQEFQDMATDADFLQLLQTKTNVKDLLDHPKTQAVLNNQELMDAMLAVDLKDLRAYLETGKSPKYSSEPILGRWSMDPYLTLLLTKRLNPNLSAREMTFYRKFLTAIAQHVTLSATPENQVTLKFTGRSALEELVRSMMPAAPPPADPNADPSAGAAPRMDPVTAQRYGLTRGGAAAAAPPADGQAQPAGNASPLVSSHPAAQFAARIAAEIPTTQGTWERDGSRYKVTLQAEGGPKSTETVVAKDDELTIGRSKGTSLVFLRVE